MHRRRPPTATLRNIHEAVLLCTCGRMRHRTCIPAPYASPMYEPADTVPLEGYFTLTHDLHVAHCALTDLFIPEALFHIGSSLVPISLGKSGNGSFELQETSIA